MVSLYANLYEKIAAKLLYHTDIAKFKSCCRLFYEIGSKYVGLTKIVLYCRRYGIKVLPKEARVILRELEPEYERRRVIPNIRHHPSLVKVAEIIMERALADGHDNYDLEVVTIKSDKYRIMINEAGYEYVETPEDIEWVSVKKRV